MENTIKAKKTIFKRWWFWVVCILIIGIIGASANKKGGSSNPSKSSDAGITKTNYEKISTGMPKGRVEDILGSQGEQSSETSIGGVTSEAKTYQDGMDMILIIYSNGKVMSKSQSGL